MRIPNLLHLVARCSHWYVCTVLIVVQQLSALPGRGGSTSAGLSVEETGARFHLLLFRNLSNFVHPTLSLIFRRDTRNRQLIYLVSVSGEINSPHMHYTHYLLQIVCSGGVFVLL